MKMSHQSGKSLPQKHKLSKNSNDHHSCSGQAPRHTENPAHNCTPVCFGSMKTDIHWNPSQKVKRLKSRKERNQIRGNKSHSSSQQSRREVVDKANTCQHIHPVSSSRKEKPFAKPFITQKPSIITEKRLTSLKGLFSNEVRSIDIERLVNEQIKRDIQKKEQRKKPMMHITPPLSPSEADSDQDCVVSEVQEPENNTPPQVKRKNSRKECRPTEFSAPKGSSRADEKLDRNANTRKEDMSNKTQQNSQCSARESEQVVLSSSENDPVFQLYSTPNETNKSNISHAGTLKSNDGGSHNQVYEEASTIVEFPNMECPQILENQQTLTSLSEPDSGPAQVADSVKQGKQMPVSCRAAVKRLATRLCKASELYVPRHRRPLLTECKEALTQALEKRHGFQLQHNLHRLHSVLNGKQAASQQSLGQRHEDCSPFSLAVKNEDGCHSRNMKIWTDSGVHQDYLSEKIKRNLDRGTSTKKRRIEEWKASSPPFFLREPQHSHTDMSLQFGDWRPAKLSQSCKAQHHPSRPLFNQDLPFTQHAAPVFRAPAWVDHPVNMYSQQHSMNRGESLKDVLSDLSRISQLWREDPDVKLNSYHINESINEKPQEALFGGSSFWSHRQQVHEEKENSAPFSFSAPYLTEGFRYEPFFRCPHPSNTQNRSDCVGMTLCPKPRIPFLPSSY